MKNPRMNRLIAGGLSVLAAMTLGAGGGSGARAGEKNRSAPSASPRASRSIPAKAIPSIDTFCESLLRVTKGRVGRRVFGLYQRDDNDPGTWKEFKQDADLAVAVKAGHVFDAAQVWTREDGAVTVSRRLNSDSGDWMQFVESCFRPEGTLARQVATLNTFEAADRDPNKEVSGATRERTRYFDAAGKQLRVTSRILDLETKLPAPKIRFGDEIEPVVKTVSALPFAPFLRAAP
jgi:hypothetical protein